MKGKKFLILDAGPIISLSMNGLIYVLERLKKDFGGEFVITPQVKHEVVDRPLGIKKYALEALRVKELIDKKVIRIASEFVSGSEIEREARSILKTVNSAFRTDYGKIDLIHLAEASCLAFSRLCKCDNVIVIDERTTRMLTEAPGNLQKLMQNKLHATININEKNLVVMKSFKFIRSTELIYIAYQKNLIPLKKSKLLLDALLYGLKYKGTAISSHEIDAMKQLARV